MPRSLVSALLFPAPRPSYSYHSFPNELLWIPRSLDYEACKSGDGDCFPAIFLRCPAARYFVIYFHSNGEDIGLCYAFGRGLRMVLEVHVLLVEYPGYGICPGRSSEETLWQVAVSAFRFAVEVLNWPAEDVIIMGRSLGAAVATQLAKAYHCHGLILVAPFLSLVDAFSTYIGALAPMLVGNIFSNEDHITRVKVPTLVIHGRRDNLVPCSQGQRLHELSPAKKKLLVTPDEMNHNSDLLSNAEFLIRPMLRFFSLPDYAFVELLVPPEAFDKTLCPQYHRLVEMTKDDAPLPQPMGDQEPGPTSTTTAGPQNFIVEFPIAAGDLDDLESSDNLFTVRTPRREHARGVHGASMPQQLIFGDAVPRMFSLEEVSGDETTSTTVDSMNAGGPSETASGDWAVGTGAASSSCTGGPSCSATASSRAGVTTPSGEGGTLASRENTACSACMAAAAMA